MAKLWWGTREERAENKQAEGDGRRTFSTPPLLSSTQGASSYIGAYDCEMLHCTSHQCPLVSCSLGDMVWLLLSVRDPIVCCPASHLRSQVLTSYLQGMLPAGCSQLSLSRESTSTQRSPFAGDIAHPMAGQTSCGDQAQVGQL